MAKYSLSSIIFLFHAISSCLRIEDRGQAAGRRTLKASKAKISVNASAKEKRHKRWEKAGESSLALLKNSFRHEKAENKTDMASADDGRDVERKRLNGSSKIIYRKEEKRNVMGRRNHQHAISAEEEEEERKDYLSKEISNIMSESENRKKKEKGGRKMARDNRSLIWKKACLSKLMAE